MDYLKEIYGDNVIYTYSREKALEDGELIDVTKMGREAGFLCPVAVTKGVMAMVNDIPEQRNYEDTEGRLWDVVWMARVFAAIYKNTSLFTYKLILPHMEYQCGINKGQIIEEATLKVVVVPGDKGEACINIMLPDEDWLNGTWDIVLGF